MKYVHFTTDRYPLGVYGMAGAEGMIQVLQGGLFETPVPSGDIVNEKVIQRYLPPITPPNILAIGRNYKEHAAETADTRLNRMRIPSRVKSD